MSKELVVLSGPTAVGKSSLAVKLAQKIGGSIISADSMQVYRGMDIGTAKITKDEMEDVPHYLIDILDPSEDFNIVTFQSLAKEALEDIYNKKRIPIIVGGTGFYIQSVIYDIDFSKGEELTDYRHKLTDLFNKEGGKPLHDMLKKVDQKAAEHIHPNDMKRLIRALEYNAQTGLAISEHNDTSRKKVSPYDLCYFVLTDDRQKIYSRIDARVDGMIEDGLVDEVKRLMDKGLSRDNVSMHGIGYKEIIDHLNGMITLDEAIYIIKRESRHFAKRQLTWFRREKDVIWLDLQNDENVLDTMIQKLRSKGIVHE